MRPTTTPRVQQGIWLPPAYGQIKINTDGAVKGLGEATSYWAESIGILESVEIAIEKGWLNVWVESMLLSRVSRLHF
ncbi:hypothetical protein IFM89_000827 [Coptis chinensis]|uniref:RNase H type-1 domain-containing protein n=1 Tax=Coptis chinensis TaxID=261450 RepID=A0A835IXG2_9MAGN|nr:hypothetical protein IFM89_000827 [Coptis chinensis]